MDRNAPHETNSSPEELCYLQAEHVESPGGTLADLKLCNRDDETVGTVEGVLIDPPARRVRYFVVLPPPNGVADRFLLSPEAIISVEPESHIARLDSDEIVPLPFNPDAARQFTAEDALTAMFSAAA